MTPPPFTLQRARGSALVALSRRGGAVRLDRLEQAGSAKAFLPRVHRDRPEVVFLNTAGGLTGGDRLAYVLRVGAGAAVTATTQTAERAYASGGGQAQMTVTLDLGAGAGLDWLPQETIIYDGAALARRTQVSMPADARLLMCETVVLGRAAMGERVARLDLTDWREVRRDGVPVLADALRLTGAALAGQAALLGGARTLANVALVAPGAEQGLDALRAVLKDAPGVAAAASAWGGKCVVRMLAADALALRRVLVRVLVQLARRPLPRVWQM